MNTFEYQRIRRGVWNVRLEGRSLGTIRLSSQGGRAGWRTGDGAFHRTAAEAARFLLEMERDVA